MSEHPPWALICEGEQSVPLDPSSVCSQLDLAQVSPIDDFYVHLEALIPLGKEDDLRANTALGKVLLLGIVSATEHYFRATISGLIRVCPVVRKQVASVQLSFGALDYYREQDLGLALLEHVSLATGGEVRKQTRNLIGVDVSKEASLDAALTQYENLCQLRHAAVHAHGELSHQNLQQLGFDAKAGRLALNIELAGFHQAAAVCQNVVRAYNRCVFRRVLERWIGQRLFSGAWQQDRLLFIPAFLLFYSNRDAKGAPTPYGAYRRFLPTLRKIVAAPRS